MKHNKHDIVSYVNDKKKIIHAKIIGFRDSQRFNLLGFDVEFPEMYFVKTRKGHIVCKYEDDVELVKDTRLEKLKRICNDN